MSSKVGNKVNSLVEFEEENNCMAVTFYSNNIINSKLDPLYHLKYADSSRNQRWNRNIRG